MIIGLDVGGTHTDVVLIGDAGLEKRVKVPTDSNDLFNSVLSGINIITADMDPKEINRIVLSTTLTTNAIVQKKIPPVGMIVTSGPGLDPEQFRTNSNYYTVSGSIDHRGRERMPIDPAEIEQVADDLQKADVQTVGVVGKFSIRNPYHEFKIAEILRKRFDKIFLGHQISGHLNFFRRIATTYLNAAMYPIHREFYQAIEKSLKAKGLRLPLRILKADGGNMNFESSIKIPGQTILSGPAASVMGAVGFSATDEDTLVMDIGGTTTDMALLINGAPVLNPQGIELGEYRTLIRALDTVSIGLGGDSTVKLNGGGLLIGPERLGAAMAYGGPAPTPTDALFVLGKMTDGNREKSVEGFASIAKKLNLSVDALAETVFESTCHNIWSAAQAFIRRINSKPVYTVHEMMEGYKVQPATILVLGGPAAYFAEALEKVSDLKVRVVPKWSVANAIGAALARTTCEVTLFADTESQIATAPEEDYFERIDLNFKRDDAVNSALELLKQKALARGGDPDYLETEIIENMEFNMVRGFNTIGKNIRVRVQVKPGLIQGYDNILAKLSQQSSSV
ncbi:MAG: hydantoinase/oxoprolinase family protein [Desulfobacterales bacterium]|jgi:N-methylhydantoinase A/oxoprolinase/acetone carboxylase beta subunit